jgi:hypothetical protein
MTLGDCVKKLFKRTFIFLVAMEGKRTSICVVSMLILLAVGLVFASTASAGPVHAQSNTAKNSTTLAKAPISTGAGKAANTTSKTQNQSKSSSNPICNIPLIRRLCKL